MHPFVAKRRKETSRRVEAKKDDAEKKGEEAGSIASHVLWSRFAASGATWIGARGFTFRLTSSGAAGIAAGKTFCAIDHSGFAKTYMRQALPGNTRRDDFIFALYDLSLLVAQTRDALTGRLGFATFGEHSIGFHIGGTDPFRARSSTTIAEPAHRTIARRNACIREGLGTCARIGLCCIESARIDDDVAVDRCIRIRGSAVARSARASEERGGAEGSSHAQDFRSFRVSVSHGRSAHPSKHPSLVHEGSH